jgi:phosphatidylinositol-3-phosphatase
MHDLRPPDRPRLPSRRTITALASLTLLSGAGTGAALPSTGSHRLSDAERSTPSSQAPAASSQPGSSHLGDAHASTSEGNAGRPDEATATETESQAGSPSSSNAGSQSSKTRSARGPAPTALLAQITHVWVIMLSGTSFEEALAQPSVAPYLTGRLVPKGTLLSHYSLVGKSPLANDIALLSGQGPNPETERGCPTYVLIAPATLGADGLAAGSGCVYPVGVQTLADQVTTAALIWRAYLQDMATPGSSVASCRHPQLGGSEPSIPPSADEDYLVARNPFVYFGSLIESKACEQDDLDLSQLGASLATPTQVPALSWIVPSACDDGSQLRCGAAPGGLAGADAFLHQVVPQILATSAYRQHGLILLTSDATPQAGAASPQTKDRRVGALVLSPFARTGVQIGEAFDTYSLLKSLERLFGVPLLGHAADLGAEELGAQVYRSFSNTTLAKATASRLARPVSG